MSTEWFSATPEKGGVTLVFDHADPLAWVWQEPEQVRAIIAKLEAALSQCDKVDG